MLLNKFWKLSKILCNSLYRKAMISNFVAASVEHDNVFRGIGEEIRCVIDIGANRGQFALVARNHFPEAMIFSFEPLSEPAIVYRHVFGKDCHSTLYEIAIGSTLKKTIIHVSNEDDSSSLLPISSLQTELYPGTSEKEIRAITEQPLDSILSFTDIPTPAILKIDVQGYENEVLLGCASLLPCFSYVFVECSFIPLYSGQKLAHEIISQLNLHSFCLIGIYNLSYDKHGIAVQGDFFFKKLTRE